MSSNERRINAIRNRLADIPGTIKVTDKFGLEKEQVAEHIFKDEQLETFIEQGNNAVSVLLGFSDLDVEAYDDIVVQYAVIQCLGSAALKERGREFVIKDNGINFNPPKISDMLFSQYQLETDIWMRKIEMLRKNPAILNRPMPNTISGNGGDITITAGSGSHVKAGHVEINGGEGEVIYNEDGAWKARGRSGTITTFGPS